MVVKVGNSYVSEAALSFAKAQVQDEEDGGNVLKSLSQKFSNLKFSVGTAPFSGTGTNNVSISPKILQEMQSKPEKRVEYEALIYDIASMNNSRPGVKSSGFIIGDDGGLRGWGISGDDDKKNISLNKKDKKSWLEKLLPDVKKKTNKPADKVEISKKGLDALKKNSPSDEEDKPNGKVAFNEAKRARQLSAAQSVEDVQALLNILQQDLDDCKEGVKNKMCDEEEVKKVKSMIERAKKKLSEVKKNPPPKNFSSIDVLI